MSLKVTHVLKYTLCPCMRQLSINMYPSRWDVELLKFTYTSYNQSQLPGNTWHIPHIPGYVTSIYPVQFQLDIWHHRHPLTTIIMNTSFHCFCLIVLNNQCPVNNKCAQYRRHVCSDLDLHNNYHSLTNWMVLNSRSTIIWW